MEGTPGLELLFSCAKAQFKSKEDVAVCLIHWNFINNGFTCIGTGEEAAAESGAESELLPEGWNQSSEVYTLRYQSTATSSSTNKKDRYLLKAVVADGTLIVNVMNLEQEKLASKIMKISDYVTDDWNTTYVKRNHYGKEVLSNGRNVSETSTTPSINQQKRPNSCSNYAGTFRNVEKLKKIFKEQLLKEVIPSPRVSKDEEPRIPYEDDPLRIRRQFPERHPRIDPLDPFNFGRTDLDPFADGSGGMIFDPLRTNPRARIPGDFPRGAIPPGARFDPIGPGGLRGRPRPDPDHLPLPNSNDYDDMFM